MTNERLGAAPWSAVVATWALLTCALVTCAFVRTAHAEEGPLGFGHKGDVVLSADRLVPLVSYTSETEPTYAISQANGTPFLTQTGTSRDSGGGLSLLWGQNQNERSHSPGLPNPYTVPRVGLDVFLTDVLTLGFELNGGISLGGANTVVTGTGSSTTTQDNPLANWAAFGAGARVGAAIHLGNMVSLWPRVGLAYNWAQTELSSTTNSVTTTTTWQVSQLGLEIDPQLVVSPWRHVGITLGMSAGIPLVSAATDLVPITIGGITTIGHVSTNANNWYVGTSLGLLLYF